VHDSTEKKHVGDDAARCLSIYLMGIDLILLELRRTHCFRGQRKDVSKLELFFGEI